MVSEEFRDYVRLVKAAALGQEFFKAYVFFKSIQNGSQDPPCRTLLDFAMEHFRVPAEGGGVVAMSCKDALNLVASMGLSLSRNGCRPETAMGPQEIAELIAEGTVCGSDEDNVQRGGDEATWNRMKSWNVVYPAADSATDAVLSIGAVNGGSNKIIPNLVPNKALNKILSEDPTTEIDVPSVDTPNIKICRGTVLGKNCLTVKVLDPVSKAVQYLYREAGNQWGPCGAINEALSVDIVDEAENVWRVLGENNLMPPDDADAEKNGHPYIFTYTHQYGNSMVLGDQKHNALFNQLQTVAENAGRWYVSSELVTEREFSQRTYSEKNITWINKLLDVNDSPFRGIFQQFDPMAASALKPFSDTEDEYDEFWGTPAAKGSSSKQTQLNHFQGEDGPDAGDYMPNPCEYSATSYQFNPADSQTGENTRAPNVEQMIEKIIEKTLKPSTGGLCDQTKNMDDLGPLVPAEFPDLTPDSLNAKYDDEGTLVGYSLKSNYYNGEDFEGGFGYSMGVNDGQGPEITFVGAPSFYSIKTIIVNNVIEEIIIENPEAFFFPANLDGSIEPIVVEIDSPVGGIINFFKDLKTDTDMERMDSITSENLNLRNLQRQLACCCTDLEEGVVLHDAGSQLRIHFSSRVQKQIERISRATNIPIGANYNANLVKDYKKDNKVITFSTNLIPIGGKNGLEQAAAPYAEDELDWIVDQVRIGAEGADPTFATMNGQIPINNVIKSLDCALPLKSETFLKNGDPFSITVLAIPQLKQGGDGVHEFEVKTLANPDSSKRIMDCSGFLSSNHGNINAREMQIEFVTPTSDDLQVDFECGKTWADMTEDERNELICEIQTKILEFAEKRAYLVNRPSYEASATVADVCLLDSGGGKVKFGDGANQNATGVPNIDQGLESLSIKIDGNGQRISFSVGTRKKLMSLRDPNADLWREINPKTANWLQPNVGQQ